MIKSKKADISVTILVIGVLAICILAIASFSFSLKQKNKEVVVSGLIEKLSSDAEIYYFYKIHFNLNSKEIYNLNIIKSLVLEGDKAFLEYKSTSFSITYPLA